MDTPKIRVCVQHSLSKSAWNIVGTQVGDKYKIARIPYNVCGDEIIDTRGKAEALQHATFIAECLNKAYWNKTESPFQQSAADTAMKLREILDEAKEQLAAKDEEIARLTAQQAEALTVAQVRDVYEAAKARDSWTGFLEWWDTQFPVSALQPAQEQADEHPAKAGYIDTSYPQWVTLTAGWRWCETPKTLDYWTPAADLWASNSRDIITAYDRYMQEGGQKQ